MRHYWATVLVVILFGCGTVKDNPNGDANGGGDGGGGDGGMDVDGVKSGSRLKVEWYDFGGTRVWAGIYDDVRRENCYPYEWQGGQRLCTPGDFTQTAYADAGCTQRYGQVYVQTGCTRPPPAYIVDFNYQGCTSQVSKLYQRGARTALGQYFYKSSDGMCYGPYQPTNYEFYALGAEVATTELAPVTVSAPSGTGRISQRFYESPDGLRMPNVAHDTQLNTDCYFNYDYGSTTAACRPSNMGYASYYENPTCTTPKMLQYSPPNGSCPTPQYVMHTVDNSCAVSEEKFYAIGTETAGAPLYYKNSPTMCTLQTPPMTNYKFFKLGGEIQLGSATRVRDQNGNRINTIHHNTGGTSIRDYSLYDNMKQTDCYPYRLADGSVRCIPFGNNSVQTMYTDAGCTAAIEIVDVYRGPTGCAPPPLSSYALKYGMCSGDYQVYTVGAPYTGALYRNFGTCQQYMPTTTIPHRASMLVPLDQFASGAKMVVD